MKTATQLLEAYLSNIRKPTVAAALFAEDGVVELPWVNVRVQGPAAIQAMVEGLLQKAPDFGFKNLQWWIQTPDRVFAEYSVEALVPSTGKTYNQTYAGLLIAESGKIKLLREALNTAEAARALQSD